MCNLHIFARFILRTYMNEFMKLIVHFLTCTLSEKKSHTISSYFRLGCAIRADPTQWLSKCSPTTSRTSIIREFVRNARFWTHWIRTCGGEAEQPEFQQAPSDPDTCWSLRPSSQPNLLNFIDAETERWRTNLRTEIKFLNCRCSAFVWKFSFLSLISK